MKRIIWTNDWEQVHDIALDIMEQEPETTEADALAIAEDVNSDYLQEDLDIDVGHPILMIADRGLWNGRRLDYRPIGTNLLNALDHTCGDYLTFYVDDAGNVCCDDTHHDGTNHYIFRALKPGKTIGTLGRKIVAGKATTRDFSASTYRLGDIFANRYGWKLRGRKPTDLHKGV